jgi:hypothetical protein
MQTAREMPAAIVFGVLAFIWPWTNLGDALPRRRDDREPADGQFDRVSTDFRYVYWAVLAVLTGTIAVAQRRRKSKPFMEPKLSMAA